MKQTIQNGISYRELVVLTGSTMLDLLPALAGFAFSSSFTPGPNNIMLTASGVNYGFRRSLPHMLGVTIGFPLMVLAVGAGLAGLFSHSGSLHDWLKPVSIGYLLYLAVRVACAAPTAADPGHDQPTSGRPLRFIEAALFQWVNPKAWIMALGAITAYTSGNGNPLVEIAVIAAVFFAAGLPSTALWTGFGTVLSRWLQSPGRRRLFNIAMGLLLAVSVIPMTGH